MVPLFLAFLITIVLTPLLIQGLQYRGVLDLPNERSSHAVPTPRGGGLAPALAVSVALVLAEIDGSTRTGLLLAVGTFGILGLVEDLVGVSVPMRLLLQLGAAAALLPWVLEDNRMASVVPVLIGFVAVLFIIGCVNAFNFMDGINGISVIQVSVTGGLWYFVGRWEGVESFAIAGAVITAAALGFAPYNFPRARVFLGDVGSYAFGGALAALAVKGLSLGIAPEAVLAPLALYLTDTGATLVRRIIRREPWARPHREHTYQQLVRAGWSHTMTSLAVGTLILVVGLLGSVSMFDANPLLRALADAAILVLLALYLATPRLALAVTSEPATA